MRVWVGLVALMMMLAGCTGGEDGSGDPTETGTGTTTDTQTTGGNATETGTSTSTSTGTKEPGSGGEEGDPSPPTAMLQVSVVNGSAPFEVNITVDGQDPDDDLVNWTLDLGDGTIEEGQTFPSSLNHTYTDDGNFTLNLTVTDAEGLTDSMAILIQVTGGALTGYEVTLTVEVPCRGCSTTTQACVDLTLGDEVLHDCGFIPIPPEAWGLSFTIESTGGDPDGRWRTGGDCPGSGADYLTADGAESGTVPNDVTCVMVWEWTTSTPSDITFRAG